MPFGPLSPVEVKKKKKTRRFFRFFPNMCLFALTQKKIDGKSGALSVCLPLRCYLFAVCLLLRYLPFCPVPHFAVCLFSPPHLSSGSAELSEKSVFFNGFALISICSLHCKRSHKESQIEGQRPKTSGVPPCASFCRVPFLSTSFVKWLGEFD